MADQKHSRAQSSSIPSKSMTDFLKLAKAQIVRAVNRANSEARNQRKVNKSRRSTNLSKTGTGVEGPGADGRPFSLSMPTNTIRHIGLSDMRVDISFVMGSIYIGNGTLGLGATAYFKDNAGNIYSSPVAIQLRGPDSGSRVVPLYASDVMKHYAAYDLEALELEFLSKQPSTFAALTLVTAPYKGARFVQVFGTGTPAAVGTVAALSVSGCQRMAGYQSRRIDMMPYVAGGFGARQNKFLTSQYSADSTSSGQQDQVQGPPCGFVVAGLGDAGGTYNGYETHDVIVRARIKLTDFIGSMYTTTGYGDCKSQKPGASPVQTGPAVSTVRVCGLADITDNSTLVPLLCNAAGHQRVDCDLQGGHGSSTSDRLYVYSTAGETKEGPIPGPPPLRPTPPTSITSEPGLREAAKQLGFVLVPKSDVNSLPPIKNDHFSSPALCDKSTETRPISGNK